MPKRIAVIDADTVLYAVASKAEINAGDGEYVPLLSARACFLECEARLEALRDEADCQDSILALSSPTNFRKEVLPTYKANRKAVRKPALLPELRKLVQDIQPWPVMVVKTLEADDVCGISAGSLAKAGKEPVIVSGDKDLQQIPGLLYNPNRTPAGNKREVEHVSEAQGDYMHLLQTLTGDTTDNYTGLPGVGPVKARSILNELEDMETPAEKWERIVNAFVDRGYTREYALIQARVARILRASDWDAVNKRPILWTP